MSARRPCLASSAVSGAATRRRSLPIEQEVVDFGFGLQPIVDIVSVSVPALAETVVCGLADHAMAKISVDGVLRAFGKRLVRRLLRFLLLIDDRHAAWMIQDRMRRRPTGPG